MTLRIRTKIIMSFTAIIIPLMLLISLLYYSRGILFTELLSLYNVYHFKVLSNAMFSLDRAIMPANDYLITGDMREKERYQEIIEEVERNFLELEMIELDPIHIELNRKAMESFQILKDKAEEIFALQNPVGDLKGSRLMYEMDALAHDIIENNMDRHYELTRNEMEEKVSYTGIVKDKVDKILLIGTIFSLVITIFFALYLIRSLVKPIGEFTEGALVIGKGRLDHRIDIKDGLEINILAEEFNRMADRLKDSYTELEKKVEERTVKLRELNNKLKELSITDGLTSLYNHRYFYERLEEEIKRATRYNHPLTLIMADIDHFKLIFDSWSRVFKTASNKINGLGSKTRFFVKNVVPK